MARHRLAAAHAVDAFVGLPLHAHRAGLHAEGAPQMPGWLRVMPDSTLRALAGELRRMAAPR